MGIRRQIRAIDHQCRMFIYGTREESAPWGLFGGLEGGRYRLERDPGVAPLVSGVGELAPGQSVAVVTPGAGGYGPPERRDQALVRRDLAEDRISPETARRAYGIEYGEESGVAAKAGR